MKIFRKNIDERQEQELLKLGYISYWLSFWLLFAVFFIQILFFRAQFQQIVGEAIVLIVVTTFWALGCIRKGIWNSHTKLSAKTYLLISILTVILNILVHISGIMIRYGFSKERLMNYFPTAITSSICIFIIMYFIMATIGSATKKRRAKLEEKYQDDEDGK